MKPYRILKALLIILCILSIVNNATAAIIKGSITDQEGNPIVASIHISQLKMGGFSNTDGFYQFKIPVGRYNMDFLYPECKTKNIQIDITNDTTTLLNIVLEKDSFNIPSKFKEKEDNKIGLNKIAQIVQQEIYNRNVLKNVKAEIYSRGSANPEKVFPLLKTAMKYTPFAFLNTRSNVFTEYIDETEYTYPDKFSRRVEDINGNIPNPEIFVKVLDEMRGALFLSKDQLFITPFTVNTLKYYHCNYEGSTLNEKGEPISKIRIESKYNDPALFNGYVYINERHWIIEQIDISNLFHAIRVSWMKVNDKNIYLPATIMVTNKVNIDGVNLDFNLYSSNKYIQIKMLDKESSFVQYKPFSTIDTYIATASAKSADFWLEKRHFPLAQNDSCSLVIRDSIASTSPIKDESKISLKKIFSVKHISTNSGKGTLTFTGLSLSLPEYNFVDGFVIGQHIAYKLNTSQSESFEINPHIYYLTGRRRLNGGVDFIRNYSKGKVTLSVGSETADFNPLGNRSGNTLSSFLWGRNNSFFYKKDFAQVNNEVAIHKRMKLIAGFTVQKRNGLENTSDFSILGKKGDIKPNMYSDAKFDKTAYWLGLEHTTDQNIVLRTEYEEAFGHWQRENSRYRKIKASISQQKPLDIFSSYLYSFEAGTFISNSKTHFADYNHFNASNSYVSAGSPFTSYMLLDSYAPSTNDFWLDLKINYTNKYLLIKKIPFFQLFPFTESVHFKSLYTPQIKYHVELGYSVNFTHHINFGVFCSVNHNNNFEKVALRFSYNLQAFKAELPKF